MSIGKNLREIRRAKGFTMKELSSKSNVSQSYISDLENEKNNKPSIDILNKLANALEIDINYFILENHKQAMKDLAERWNAKTEEERKAISDKIINEWENEKNKSIQDTILTIAENADCIDFFLTDENKINFDVCKDMFDTLSSTMKFLCNTSNKNE
ncbi:helix-turn-helix transcriptional regulator [Clostridium perfringens]|nr:helix-turn-helix transcriptional regulator [Clostridium perfringens]